MMVLFNFSSRLAFVVPMVAALCSCASHLGPEVPVSPGQVRELREAGVDNRWNDSLGVSIRPLEDARSPSAMGLIGGTTIKASGDVSIAVRMALEEHLRASGVTLSATEGPSIGGEVLEWYSAIRTGFPTSVAEAHAALRLRVYDPDLQVVYYGTYRGEALNKVLWLTQGDVEESLGEAMAQALDEALADPRLVAAVRRATG